MQRPLNRVVGTGRRREQGGAGRGSALDLRPGAVGEPQRARPAAPPAAPSRIAAPPAAPAPGLKSDRVHGMTLRARSVMTVRPTSSIASPRRRRIAAPLAVVGLVAVLYGVNLGGWRTLGAHEALAAVPARAMADGNGGLNGGWLVPDFGGIPRVKKPPLGYWLIAAAEPTDRPGRRLRRPAALRPVGGAAVRIGGLVGRRGGTAAGGPRRGGRAGDEPVGPHLRPKSGGRRDALPADRRRRWPRILTAPSGAISPVRRRRRWAAVWTLAGVGVARQVSLRPGPDLRPAGGSTRCSPGAGANCDTPPRRSGVAAFVGPRAPWTALMLTTRAGGGGGVVRPDRRPRRRGVRRCGRWGSILFNCSP